ncbi:TPA: hypothetical protein DCP77_02205 [Candidatus Collierbacteria bacterium]|uniref:Intein-containing protein n=1 Tax=Candidatus Collierbacteria bacterium GW2011_GWA2_42_17 TaxID=1618378 RepID=A0A0G1BZG0_9BACT|nr:MAG: Intein-containing protein [Candidatus Collierbacteria bacterium GW2011_GWA2_42_17]KKS62275.1 MAG: Intein-containing protein [Candidatus Collierbacteria bacterium GW2011_GWE2_42_48]KKS64087.1 MAG: Intein-containing protein [Candidatus Collierbacteria bacterium GW2011_GWF2_42_51]KKS66762.1 MAG: Intein-containing protein [Candidatus Collierbacteria bacterium GW2011_GWA1_42_60]HAI22203.1 hypothetical protein [Candidatus Collierbacteria bacterium]
MKISKYTRRWSRQFAYAIGLIVTDGSLSIDGRHIDFSSIDIEQIKNLLFCLHRECKIGIKKSGSGNECYRVQFSDVSLYRFLLGIGLSSHKSKTIGSIFIPNKYFFDFLRGHFDGDGSVYAYKDSRWKSSLMFYMSFVSASENHIKWIRKMLKSTINIYGCLTKTKSSSVYQLRYAKKESLVLIRKLYYNSDVVCLSRKRDKIYEILSR